MRMNEPAWLAVALVLLAAGVSCRPSTGAVSRSTPPTLAPGPVGAPLPVRDATGEFWTYWQVAQREDDAARVARFRAEVVPTFPELYAYTFALWRRRGLDPDAELAKRLRAFEPVAPTFGRLRATFPDALRASAGDFRRTFPDFAPEVDVRMAYAITMDGGTRTLAHRAYLVFGLDVIAALHPSADPKPFFTHELFHVYHDEVRGRDRAKEDSLEEETHEHADPLYVSLWEEGLATYVSAWANPGATDEALLLAIPRDLMPACRANLAWLAGDVRAKIDSVAPRDYSEYLNFSSEDPRRPKRAGYCLGMLIAREVHRTMPMDRMVRLDGAELRAVFVHALDDLAPRPTRAE
jgi:hypothetical protein